MNFQLRPHAATCIQPLTESFVGGRTLKDNKEFCLWPEKLLSLCDNENIPSLGISPLQAKEVYCAEAG